MLLRFNGIKGRVDSNDIARTLEVLADANDHILERVTINIDEASGVKKNSDPMLIEVLHKSTAFISGSWNKRPGTIIFNTYDQYYWAGRRACHTTLSSSE